MIKLKCYYCGRENTYSEKDISSKIISLEDKHINAEYVLCKNCKIERIIKLDGKNID